MDTTELVEYARALLFRMLGGSISDAENLSEAGFAVARAIAQFDAGRGTDVKTLIFAAVRTQAFGLRRKRSLSRVVFCDPSVFERCVQGATRAWTQA